MRRTGLRGRPSLRLEPRCDFEESMSDGHADVLDEVEAMIRGDDVDRDIYVE